MSGGFFAELEKIAASPAFLNTLRRRAVGAGLRVGTSAPSAAALGALVGGAAGAVTADEGEPRAGRVISGALGGAALGGGVGLGGRVARDYKLLHPNANPLQVAGGTARVTGKAIANFGKRQIHGFTGAYGKDPASIGLASSQLSKKKSDIAKLRHVDEASRGAVSLGRKAEMASELRGIAREGREGDRQLRAGITSVPGIVRGLAKNPVGTTKELAHAAFGGNPAGAAVGLGLPVAIAAPGIARGDERDVGGHSVGQKLVGLGTNIAGGVLTAGMPVIPNVLVGGALDHAVAPKPRRIPPLMPELDVGSRA